MKQWERLLRSLHISAISLFYKSINASTNQPVLVTRIFRTSKKSANNVKNRFPCHCKSYKSQSIVFIPFYKYFRDPYWSLFGGLPPLLENYIYQLSIWAVLHAIQQQNFSWCTLSGVHIHWNRILAGGWFYNQLRFFHLWSPPYFACYPTQTL